MARRSNSGARDSSTFDDVFSLFLSAWAEPGHGRLTFLMEYLSSMASPRLKPGDAWWLSG